MGAKKDVSKTLQGGDPQTSRTPDKEPSPPDASAIRGIIAGELQKRVPGMSEVDAKDIEIGMFNWAIDRSLTLRIARTWNDSRFRALYASRARMVIANLDPDSYVGNVDLAKRLIEHREFLPHDIAYMPPDRMFPARWKRELDIKQQRDAYITHAPPAAVTDQFRCSRCRQRQCTYYELQTRSCDEPASIFVQCLVCSNRWRIG